MSDRAGRQITALTGEEQRQVFEGVATGNSQKQMRLSLKGRNRTTVARAYAVASAFQGQNIEALDDKSASVIAEKARYDATPHYVKGLFLAWKAWRRDQARSQPSPLDTVLGQAITKHFEGLTGLVECLLLDLERLDQVEYHPFQLKRGLERPRVTFLSESDPLFGSLRNHLGEEGFGVVFDNLKGHLAANLERIIESPDAEDFAGHREFWDVLIELPDSELTREALDSEAESIGFDDLPPSYDKLVKLLRGVWQTGTYSGRCQFCPA